MIQNKLNMPKIRSISPVNRVYSFFEILHKDLFFSVKNYVFWI